VDEGAHQKKGGVLPVALVGSNDFDVADVDPSTIRLEGVAPLTQGGGPKFDDVATPYDPTDCACTNANADGTTDLMMKFQSLEIATAIVRGAHRDTRTLTLVGQLYNGTWFCAEDCITFVGNQPPPEPDTEPIPENTVLGVATPNPFNPITRINYSLRETGSIDLSIYDVQGRLVERLVSGVQNSGDHSVTWNASGVASGIYFYRLTAGSFTETRKLVLLK